MASQPMPGLQTLSASAAIDFQPDQARTSGDPPLSLPEIVEPSPVVDEPVQPEVDDRLLLFRYSPSHESWRRKSMLTCGECAYSTAGAVDIELTF